MCQRREFPVHVGNGCFDAIMVVLERCMLSFCLTCCVMQTNRASLSKFVELHDLYIVSPPASSLTNTLPDKSESPKHLYRSSSILTVFWTVELLKPISSLHWC